MVKWYFVFSFCVLLTWALGLSVAFLYEPFNGFAGFVIQSNRFHEGWLEFGITLAALPGWLVVAKEYLALQRGAKQ